MNFINDSGLDFIDISSEKYRIYYFPCKEKVIIDNPLKLNISQNGHRIFDGYKCHYIPIGWIHLEWEVKENKAHFIK